MKTLIKIDRNSIKKNPEGGNTETIINRHREIIIKGRNKIPEYLNFNNFYLTKERSMMNGRRDDWEGRFRMNDESENNSLLEKLNNEKSVSIETIFHTQRVTHKPLPIYLFEYENSRIICECCGNEFMSDDFKSGVDDEDENYCETICPLCDGWNTILNMKNLVMLYWLLRHLAHNGHGYI